MSAHLGERVASLVDGELQHAARERALAHLAHCTACRGEVEAHRRLKSSLMDLRAAPAQPSSDLSARLLAVAAQQSRVPDGPPATPRGLRRPQGARRPAGRATTRPRRAATAGVLLVVGLAGALVLGSPAASGPVAPVDPSSPSFVVDHVSTTSEVPLTEPAFASFTPVGAAGPGR